MGIGVALYGGPPWAEADDWAALLASAVILINGVRILLPAVADLMDRTPPKPVISEIRKAAQNVPAVDAIETLRVRRSGLGLFVDVHVQADPELSLRDAHILSGKVKTAVKEAAVLGVLVHMEPFEESDP